MTSNQSDEKIKDIDQKIEKYEQKDKLQYKQFVLIILLTVIMVLVSLALSFSVVNMIQTDQKDLGYNSIIVPIKPIPGPGPGDDDKPGDDDDDEIGIVFNYKEKETVGNGILIKNMLPTDDEVGKAFVGDYYTFEFTLYFGNRSYNRYYEITAETLDITNLDGKYVKIYLESDNQAVANVVRSDGKIKKFTEYRNATINKKNDQEKIIHSGTINRRDIAMGHKTFVLKMWVADDMPLNTDTVNKTFAVRINVYAK